MAKDPAFLFYPNDYIGGTMGMSFEEKGAYMELLMLQFNRGHMTTHMIGQTVGQLWDKIQDKFVQDENGLYYNRRLEEEIKKRQAFVKSRRNNISGKNQYTKNNAPERGHMEGHMTSHMENENGNIINRSNYIINNNSINENNSSINKDNSSKKKEKGGLGEKEKSVLKKIDFIQEVINAFCDLYEQTHGTPYEIISPGKEREMAGKIVSLYKKKFPDSDSEKALGDLRDYFTRCINIQDDWLRTHMSLSVIVSKFNEINNILRNGNGRKTGVTDLELATIVAKHFGK